MVSVISPLKSQKQKAIVMYFMQRLFKRTSPVASCSTRYVVIELLSQSRSMYLCNAILVNTQSFPPVYFRIVSAPIGFVCVPLSESEVRIASVHLQLLDIED